MPIRIKSLNALVLFVLAVGAGIALTLLLAQWLWAESSKSRINSYTHTLLQQSESVAEDLTRALQHLNSSRFEACSEDDLAELKKVAFEYRFLKDAGRIRDGQLICSAVWEGIKMPYKLGTPTLVTRNQVTLWIGVPSYAMPDRHIDISARERGYVVTSPTAFATFENHSAELSSIVTSADGTRVLRRFGVMGHAGDRMLRREARSCSAHYDICVIGQIDSNIFATAHAPLLVVIATVGAFFGGALWLAVQQVAARRSSMSARLARAIAQDQIRLEYQPIVHAASGALAGVEALARWHDRVLGEVRPDIFIAKAAEIKLTAEFNRRIIARALRECATRLREQPDIYVSINLDIEAFLDADMVSFLAREAQRNGLAPRQVAIELLEGATTDIATMRTGVAAVRALGFQVFIDDFGTGYSGLAYLGRLDVDKIKIDRIFTQSAGTATAAAKILSMVHDLAQGIETGVVFEGVETEAQMRAILAFCPDALAQGWLYSKAVPIADIRASYC